MEPYTHIVRLVPVLVVALMVLLMPVDGQISTSCTSSIITSFAPCMNLLTKSSYNGTSPTADCCNSLKSMTNNGMDCLCLLVTGSVPFQLPINRSLAISLPRACNIPGVPLQCKASAAPIPAPGPIALGPTLSSDIAPSLSPTASTVPNQVSPALAPEADTTTNFSPSSPTADSEVNSGISPSASNLSRSFLPLLLLALLGATVLKDY